MGGVGWGGNQQPILYFYRWREGLEKVFKVMPVPLRDDLFRLLPKKLISPKV
ncbi:hypothetical protein D1BOALGB6SA_1745 [Olavius sp. associated proteobacterium Delta 1]|nr:hypothetical protein D1BOALGB6SA_1745 [Olavius sp. associated proteobacterium Delta 1]